MNPDIKVIDGKLVYGLEDCVMCDENGKVFGRMTCPKCKGTHRTKGGFGKGECRNCLDGKINDFDPAHKIFCSVCNGSHKVQANSCSYVPDEVVEAIPMRVFRSDRAQTLAEYLFGVGLFSCTDYGRHAQMSDEDLVADVRRSATCVQGTKIAKDDGTLCDYIGIFCNHSGYTVQGVWEVDNVRA